MSSNVSAAVIEKNKPSPHTHFRYIALTIFALAVSLTIWFVPSNLGDNAKIAFITYSLAVIGWSFTNINDTYIALIAALVPITVGIDEPNEFFESLGDSMIWLLLAAFIIAAASSNSGLSHRLVVAVAARTSTVKGLFFGLATAILITAFFIPSTSGRAAVMVPVFLTLSASIADKAIVRALALLFPIVILLSAAASLIGAGAHLMTAEILWHTTGEKIGFGEWLVLGSPFALASCFISVWVLLRIFLNSEQRRQNLQFNNITSTGASSPHKNLSNKPWTRDEKFTLMVAVLLVLLWTTEAIHGIDNAVVALIGALVVTAPSIGTLSFKDGIKKVEWNLLIFMAATLELSEALIESGGAKWLVEKLFNVLQGNAAASELVVISGIALFSLFSHLFITSRTARSAALIPLIVLLATSLGYDPTSLAFLSTVAAGYCLTLAVSAKPLAMFSQLEGETFRAKDLLRLSAVLLPVHFILLLVFAFWIWPVLGLDFTHQIPAEPRLPEWNSGSPYIPPGAGSVPSAPPNTSF